MIKTEPSSLYSKSTGYGFRDNTKEQSAVASAVTPRKSSRQVLTPSKSGSLVQDEGHDCDHLNTDHIVSKVAARLFHSLFRFTLSHAFNCLTRRGPTHLNGARSTCGGCEAAHAALSPTLFDDILETIATNLGSQNFDELDELHQCYLRARFDLNNEDEEALSSDDAAERISKLDWIVSRLTTLEKKGTYVNTPTEHARNATFDNARSSNKVDCFLESKLRPQEETLSKRCKEGAITPIEALTELQTKYREHLENAQKNLKTDLISLHTLLEAWNELTSCQLELHSLDTDSDDFTHKFTEYVIKVELYLAAYKHMFDRQEGTPRLKSFKQSLRDNRSINILKKIQKNKETKTFIESSKKLVNSFDPQSQFNEVEAEISRRLVEVENQLKVVTQTPEEIKGMYKHLFGEVNDLGILQTPTKEKVQAKFLELVSTVTPTRSDRNK
jgi:hypothetical protein